MNSSLPLPQEKKLTVLFRVEAGCLGPNGEAHVDRFCDFAQAEVANLEAEFIHWEIVPRSDKSKPEMEYRIGGRSLNHDMARRYLDAFEQNLDEFEEHLNERILHLIERYQAAA